MAERAGLFEEDLDLSQFTPQEAGKGRTTGARSRPRGR